MNEKIDAQFGKILECLTEKTLFLKSFRYTTLMRFFLHRVCRVL